MMLLTRKVISSTKSSHDGKYTVYSVVDKDVEAPQTCNP